VQEPDTMRDGGLGKLHKKMRRFGDTVSRATYRVRHSAALRRFDLEMC
jgi:hypothetical protein